MSNIVRLVSASDVIARKKQQGTTNRYNAMQDQNILPIGGIPFADLYDIAHTSALYTDQTTACIPCQGNVNFVLRQYKSIQPPCTFGWTARETLRAWSDLASSADGNILYATSETAYIYKSIDSGVSWNQKAPAEYWTSIATSTDGVKVVAMVRGLGIQDGKIYTSGDSGDTWSQIIVTNQNWTSVASSSDGVNLVACCVARGGILPEGGIYTSSDSGASWGLTTAPYPYNWLCVASSANGVNLVACAFDTPASIYTSGNSGANWSPITIPSLGNLASVASSSSGEILYAGDDTGVWKSTNYGSSWTQTLVVSGVFLSIDTSINGDKVIAVVADGSVYRSTDSGTTWDLQVLSPPPSFLSATASSADGEKMVVAGTNTLIYTGACT
jgi:photosystem II stability/assembly factor-like uncharacterized protein